MEQSLLIVSGPSDSNNKFGLGANTDDDEFWMFNDDNEDDDVLFTMSLPNISDQAKNGLFIAFSRSNSFGVLEHNALLDALAHPVKGLNLFEFDELGFDLIINANI
ncbi:hypothetical protein GLOIN_2v1768830 [Rhizophagus irregularis DAOM 181602=DAOM 197198]|nr:hypothetical protein GLOIN_2v1768830 [Rhizophagus irregularis DAOM 181602=DAOM 197198]